MVVKTNAKKKNQTKKTLTSTLKDNEAIVWETDSHVSVSRLQYIHCMTGPIKAKENTKLYII